MDRRIEAFLADVLALAGENPDAIREGVRVALADCEALFRLQEPKKRMRDQAAHACRALCRARVMSSRRFPPPWSVEEANSKLDRRCFIVRDANGQALARS